MISSEFAHRQQGKSRSKVRKTRNVQPAVVVVVTWNSAAEIEACLNCVVPQHPQEIVVVDNGSVDATIQIVQSNFPSVRIICLPQNYGFSYGCNVGIRSSQAPYILTLNDDARLEPGYIASLVSALEASPAAASATGKLINVLAGCCYIDSAGIQMRWHSLCPVDRGHGELDRGQFDGHCTIFGPSAAAALYRRAALNDVGPEFFDEDLGSYYEDVDLAWRLNQRGWVHLYVPTAKAVHPRRGPSAKPLDIAARAYSNRYLIWCKNEELPRFLLYSPLALLWESGRLCRIAVQRPVLLWRAMEQMKRRIGRIWAKRRKMGCR